MFPASLVFLFFNWIQIYWVLNFICTLYWAWFIFKKLKSIDWVFVWSLQDSRFSILLIINYIDQILWVFIRMQIIGLRIKDPSWRCILMVRINTTISLVLVVSENIWWFLVIVSISLVSWQGILINIDLKQIYIDSLSVCEVFTERDVVRVYALLGLQLNQFLLVGIRTNCLDLLRVFLVAHVLLDFIQDFYFLYSLLQVLMGLRDVSCLTSWNVFYVEITFVYYVLNLRLLVG